MESVNQMSNYVNKGLDFVNKNKILSSVLGMLLVLYAAAAAPKLPKSVVKIFDNSLFKLGFMFMIAYLATKDPSVAIITAVALLVTIQTLASREAAEAVVKAVEAESKPVVYTESKPVVYTESNPVVAAELKPVAPAELNQVVAAELNQVAYERAVVRQEAVKESFAENEDIRIPLSPSRAEFIEECTRRADAHYNAATKAESEGKPALAEAHKQEAAKQEIKIDAVVIAKQHIIAAEEAKSNGNGVLAEAHMQEAAKQETKAEAIVKSEAHVVAAEEAKSNGNVALAEAHMQEAAKQEAKAEAIVKSEAHVAAAEEALRRGAVAEAEAHKKAAVAEEAKVISMVKAEAEMARRQVQPERVIVETEITGLPVPLGEVQHAPVLAEPESPVAEVRKARSEVRKAGSRGSPFDVEGYSMDAYSFADASQM